MIMFPRRFRRGRRIAGVTGMAALLATGALGAAAIVSPRAAHADDWPMLRGDERRTGIAGEVLAPPLSLLWRHTGAALQKNTSAPAVVGDTVYFAGRATNAAGSGGVVFAVDAKTGARKWIYPNETGLLNRSVFTTAPTVHDGRVYIGATNGNMYVLDAKTGREVHSPFRTGAAILSAPLVTKLGERDVIYFGSNDRKFYALDPETGASVWQRVVARRTEPYLYRTADNINSAPVLANGMLFFTTSDQYVHAINALDGKVRYATRLQFRFEPNFLVYADNTLYIPSGPRLHAIQPTSGNLRWGRDLPGDILTAPAAVEGVVYAVCRNSRTQSYELYALRSNGREYWKTPAVLPYAPNAAPTVSGDVIYIPTNRNVLMAVSRVDGKLLWEYRFQPSTSAPGAVPAGDIALSAPVAIANGTLYALADDGTLSAFRKDAPDQTGPLVSEPYPRPGQAVNGGPGLVLAAKLTDPGSGLDTESFRLMLDDRDLTPSFDATRNLLYYQTKSSGKIVESATIPDGRHTVTLVAKDWRGNEHKETWSFVVDNGLPRATSTPAPPPRPGGIGAPGGGRTRGGNTPGGGGTTPPPPPPPSGG